MDIIHNNKVVNIVLKEITEDRHKLLQDLLDHNSELAKQHGDVLHKFEGNSSTWNITRACLNTTYLPSLVELKYKVFIFTYSPEIMKSKEIETFIKSMGHYKFSVIFITTSKMETCDEVIEE